MPSGGKRIGAGKKPGKHGAKLATSMKLSDDVLAFLRTQESASAYVDETIRKTKAFREFMAGKSA